MLKRRLVYTLALLMAMTAGTLTTGLAHDVRGGARLAHAVLPASITFPLSTSMSVLQAQQPLSWCRHRGQSCQHDYNAADIFAPTFGRLMRQRCHQNPLTTDSVALRPCAL